VLIHSVNSICKVCWRDHIINEELLQSVVMDILQDTRASRQRRVIAHILHLLPPRVVSLDFQLTKRSERPKRTWQDTLKQGRIWGIWVFKHTKLSNHFWGFSTNNAVYPRNGTIDHICNGCSRSRSNRISRRSRPVHSRSRVVTVLAWAVMGLRFKLQLSHLSIVCML